MFLHIVNDLIFNGSKSYHSSVSCLHETTSRSTGLRRFFNLLGRRKHKLTKHRNVKRDQPRMSAHSNLNLMSISFSIHVADRDPATKWHYCFECPQAAPLPPSPLRPRATALLTFRATVYLHRRRYQPQCCYHHRRPGIPSAAGQRHLSRQPSGRSQSAQEQ